MRRNRMPRGGIGAIAAIIALELVFCTKSEPLTGIPLFQPTADDATLVAKRGLFGKISRSVALIGDSSCMMGLIPRVIEQETGLRVVNLGTLASFTMAGYAAIGEELLEQSDPPSVLVLAVLPRSFEFTEIDARKFDLLGRYLVAYDKRSPAYEASLEDYRSWFYKKHQFNKFPPRFGNTFANFSQLLQDSNGFMEEAQVYCGSDAIQREFHASAFATESIMRLIQAAEDKMIPVMFWWSPSPADAVSPAYLKDAHATARGIQDELAWLQVPQDEAPAWEVRLFGSVTHLTKEGAIRNSKGLASVLRSSFLSAEPGRTDRLTR